ncbi:hypothetical protein ASE73_15605 [Sphingomonas sp. Leaf24]|nr:hypothetical protein ASE50_13835 [Sphingomonas sp. Leaf5]KQM93590.1 hypothetical protein ASE73_15605 [Sphingomonas sp. Leaf24]
MIYRQARKSIIRQATLPFIGQILTEVDSNRSQLGNISQGVSQREPANLAQLFHICAISLPD